MDQKWDVIVVGAGLAGLTAGVTAAKAGSRTLVLDAHQPGGRARSTVTHGFTFNMGARALYHGGPAAEVLARLGCQPTGSQPPLGRYKARLNGELHSLPTGPWPILRTRLLGIGAKARLARALASLGRLDPLGLAGQTVTEWLGALGLGDDAEGVMKAVVRLSTYAEDLDSFGADGAVQQIQYSLREGVGYLDGGWAQLVNLLSSQVQVEPARRVVSISSDHAGVEVETTDGRLVARQAVLACGSPRSVLGLIPVDPGWGQLGPEVSAACLDAGVSKVPSPGYVLGIDEPLYATTQGPPADLAPPGQAAIGVLRYGAGDADSDRADCRRYLSYAGVVPGDVVTERFLAHMVVAGAAPRADRGGLAGRPTIAATGLTNVHLAGDWVGPVGLLADAAIASGHAAGLAAAEPRAAVSP